MHNMPEDIVRGTCMDIGDDPGCTVYGCRDHPCYQHSRRCPRKPL
jgi:hypothetical protein